METIRDIFRYKKADPAALAAFGFLPCREGFIYTQKLAGGDLIMTVTVDKNSAVTAHVTDTSGEPYVLHLIEYAAGSFVGQVRLEYDELLKNIATSCFVTDIFRKPQTKEIITYIQSTYQRSLEFLWPDTPQNAIWRRSDNGKWFGALLTVPKNRLGISSSETAEILNLRASSQRVACLLTQEHYYPSWHMNKKYWYTVILDGSVPTTAICRHIDESYQSVGKKCK